MNKSILPLLIATCLLFISCSSVKPNTEPKTPQEEAMDKAMKITESFFTHDCEYFYQSLSSSLYMVNGEKMDKNQIPKARLCEDLHKAVKSPGKTFQDYRSTYQQKILDLTAMRAKYGKDLPESFPMQEGDFLFEGYELKPGKEESENFIWDDLYTYILRKENGNWVIKIVFG